MSLVAVIAIFILPADQEVMLYRKRQVSILYRGFGKIPDTLRTSQFSSIKRFEKQKPLVDLILISV